MSSNVPGNGTMWLDNVNNVITTRTCDFLCLAAADRIGISTSSSTYFLFLMLYMDRVVCRMLGFSFGYVMFSTVPGNGTIWLDDVNCTGSERRLIDCNHRPWGSHNCDHRQDVGIVCGKEGLFLVRLLGIMTIWEYEGGVNRFQQCI